MCHTAASAAQWQPPTRTQAHVPRYSAGPPPKPPNLNTSETARELDSESDGVPTGMNAGGRRAA